MNIQTLKQIKSNFVAVLEKATSGEQTSLPFIKHHLATASLVKSGDVFQTLVIGGSLCQKATMKKEGDQIQILNHDQGPQPPFLTKADLMTFLETHINPDVEVVALNFAYPLTPVLRDGILEGVLQTGSKENTFDGLVGMPVGEEIEKYMKQMHGRTIKVSLANDTICLLLSGLIHHSWDSIAAGVVGTGLNFALFLDKHVTINLESSEFKDFTPSEAGREIDRMSAAPGRSLYEKEVSGAYLYKHFNILAKKRGLSKQMLDSTRELDVLVTDEDAEVATLAREILDHSASLAASQIAGILEFSKRDLVFIMQGSLYWKGSKYKETVEKLVAELTPNYHATYEQVPHSDLFGAAKLVG